MINENDPTLSSADQDKWVEIAESLRHGIEQMIPRVSKMSPSDFNDFTHACLEVYQLNIRAHVYDAKLQKEGLPFGDNGCV